MKKIFTIVTILFLLLFPYRTTFAYDPQSVPNNKFGIHILDEHELDDAANLVNSSGGDWGYVTIVIKESERNHDRWQKVFDRMRKLHLIPIVRLATSPEGDTWSKPKDEEINNWISFLNSLNWVVKNRYIVIGNEPNHAKEWGGEVSPTEYSDYLKSFSTSLKSASSDFFILPAGLDASAPNSKITMSETVFLQKMIEENPDVYDLVDGWNSHSYPNPNFSGRETDRGRGTITTFNWELAYLKELGIEKDFPVFITETGWSHKIKDQVSTNKLLDESLIGNKLSYSFENVWSDKRVVAVTPFLLNYTTPPFDIFSWKAPDGTFYSFYDHIKKLPKIKGQPIQEVKGKILGVFVNPFVIVGSSFKGIVLAQNLGQSVWVSPEIHLDNESQDVIVTTDPYLEVEPYKLRLIHFSSEPLNETGVYKVPLVLRYKENNISPSYPFEVFVIKPPEVKNLSLFDKILGYFQEWWFKYKGP